VISKKHEDFYKNLLDPSDQDKKSTDAVITFPELSEKA